MVISLDKSLLFSGKGLPLQADYYPSLLKV
jgi:hypothetical protein